MCRNNNVPGRMEVCIGVLYVDLREETTRMQPGDFTLMPSGRRHGFSCLNDHVTVTRQPVQPSIVFELHLVCSYLLSTLQSGTRPVIHRLWPKKMLLRSSQ